MKPKIIRIRHTQTLNLADPALTCPGCKNNAIFIKCADIPDLRTGDINGVAHSFGQRKCPDSACGTHVFIYSNSSNEATQSYPTAAINFDSKNIPAQIADSLEEAITCFGEDAYIAAAIMIRRTLEELCQEKAANGADLKKKIAALKSNVVLPEHLFTAMDELRLLGNDAAHIESRIYDQIGKEEVSIAIELTMEILKAVYQLDGLVKRLQSLKK